MAAAAANTEILQFLVGPGRSVSAGKVHVCEAALHGRIDVLDFLLSQGCSIHARTCDDYSPILLAAKGGHIETFKFLLSKGANAEDATQYRCTAFLLASKSGHLDMVRFLLQSGLASPNERTKNNVTALFYATMVCYNSQLDCD